MALHRRRATVHEANPGVDGLLAAVATGYLTGTRRLRATKSEWIPCKHLASEVSSHDFGLASDGRHVDLPLDGTIWLLRADVGSASWPGDPTDCPGQGVGPPGSVRGAQPVVTGGGPHLVPVEAGFLSGYLLKAAWEWDMVSRHAPRCTPQCRHDLSYQVVRGLPDILGLSTIHHNQAPAIVGEPYHMIP